jgi:hypothetical protein
MGWRGNRCPGDRGVPHLFLVLGLELYARGIALQHTAEVSRVWVERCNSPAAYAEADDGIDNEDYVSDAAPQRGLSAAPATALPQGCKDSRLAATKNRGVPVHDKEEREAEELRGSLEKGCCKARFKLLRAPRTAFKLVSISSASTDGIAATQLVAQEYTYFLGHSFPHRDLHVKASPEPSLRPGLGFYIPEKVVAGVGTTPHDEIGAPRPSAKS